MVLVAAAWGADREGGLRLGIWAEVERERGGVGGERWRFRGYWEDTMMEEQREDRRASSLPPHLLL